MTRIRLFVAAGILTVAAVARPSAAQTSAPQPAPAVDGGAAVAPAPAPQQERRRPRRRPDVITADELAESGATDLYQAVQRLRPQWLRASGARSLSGGAAGTVVYQNNTELGGLDALRQLGIGFASELRYLDGSEASNTLPGLGSRLVSGAIIVRTGNAR
jgi:hypothetical protein